MTCHQGELFSRDCPLSVWHWRAFIQVQFPRRPSWEQQSQAIRPAEYWAALSPRRRQRRVLGAHKRRDESTGVHGTCGSFRGLPHSRLPSTCGPANLDGCCRARNSDSQCPFLCVITSGSLLLHSVQEIRGSSFILFPQESYLEEVRI